ncbi:methyl-accepting chemotaxis protein, partial [Campylobacter sp. MIT 12-8780]|uniref:methyl-accepting chemotaxis protein n=1 Tax=Campylobacter sp. MIT 12-8780 TaxID=2202200 RepID=UPI00115CC0E8
MGSNKSLGVASKLTIWVGALIVLVLGVASMVSYFDAKNKTFELLRENQFQVVEGVLSTFNSYDSQKRKVIEILAQEVAKSKITEEDFIAFATAFKEANDFDLVYIALESNGKNYQSNGQILDLSVGYDTKNRPWYVKAKQEGKLIVTEPYKSIDNGQTSLTFAMPFYDQSGNLKGVVGGDYSVNKYSQDILSSVSSANFYVGVYDKISENIIFHQDKDKVLTKNKLSQTIFDSIKAKPYLLEDDEIFFAKDDEGVEQAIMCTPSLANPNYFFCSVMQASIYSSYSNQILLKQVAAGSIFIIIALVVVRFLISRSLFPLRAIQNALNSFFDFLNYKTKDIAMINIKGNDEFGQISKVINENILQTKKGLEQDSQAVQQSVQTVHIVEEGDLSARITAHPKNPQLIELKNVLNRLLDVLQHRVGSNLNTIREVFEEYRNLDFRNKIPNASGNVEVTTNILGDEIVKMLKTSSDFAHSLSEESGKLQEAVNALTQSSNSQAHSLEETAAALEQITSSMQNVSTKTSDVITQSEEIKNV